MSRVINLSGLVLMLALGACAGDAEEKAAHDTHGAKPASGHDTAPDAHEAAPAKGADAHAVHWAYAGEEGPAHWGEIAAEYATCATGQAQSPIDLGNGNAVGDVALRPAYGPVMARVVNNGHAIEAKVEGEAAVDNGVGTYRLAQYHFHSPSEHTIDGHRFPLEVHFVHKSDAGELLVLGVVFEAGEKHPELDRLTDAVGRTDDAGGPIAVELNPATFLPADLSVYRYMGSLTTPPCSEGVNWHVAATPIEASEAQIVKLVSMVGQNARPLQEVHQRLVIDPAL